MSHLCYYFPVWCLLFDCVDRVFFVIKKCLIIQSNINTYLLQPLSFISQLEKPMHSRVIFKNLSGTLMVCFYVRIFYSSGIYFGISSGYVFSFVIPPKKVSQLTQHERIIHPFLIVLNAIFIIYQIPINIYMISDLSSLLLICLCIPMLALVYLNFLCFIVYFNI